MVIVDITDRATGETLRFRCWPFWKLGLAINPAYSVFPDSHGGSPYYHRDTGEWWWRLWPDGDVRPLTEHERMAVEYLYLLPPLPDGTVTRLLTRL